jgi:hypothetical protein
MAPFEMLYGRRCQTPLFWNETGEQKVFGPDILQEAEKQVCMVRENFRVAQSRQKSYANHTRRELSFEVGGFVYLKVSPMRGLRRFKVRGKFSPRFIGPFKILEKVGEVAYQLELPPQLSDVHDVFHVSQLKKCLHVPEEQIPMEELDAKEDLSYQEYHVKILEMPERVTQNKRIKMCKVQCIHHTEESKVNLDMVCIMLSKSKEPSKLLKSDLIPSSLGHPIKFSYAPPLSSIYKVAKN